MPADAIPPRRNVTRDEPSRFLGEDGSLMLLAYEDKADAFWMTFTCAGARGCHRTVDLGFRPAIARFGRTMTIRGIARRLRCSACGGRHIVQQVSVDVRSAESRRLGDVAPETAADLPPH